MKTGGYVWQLPAYPLGFSDCTSLQNAFQGLSEARRDVFRGLLYSLCLEYKTALQDK